MRRFRQFGVDRAAATALCLISLGVAPAAAQQLDASSVIRHIDAAVQARFEAVAGFTVSEHYAVYRGKDEAHPAAEMTVRTTYRKDTGKSYTIVSESGSAIIRRFGLIPLLDNEKSINQPGNVERSWFTSANYEMKLKSGGIQTLNGRECLALAVTPRRKAPNLIQGTLWVGAKDYSIVQIEGTASGSPSVWAGPTHMMRQYANVSGFAMATHARAVSNSFLFGRTIVTIDYQDYRIQLRPTR
ncbi:MAG: hypothetical protein WBM14_05395 [Terracidiphilus sp.]